MTETHPMIHHNATADRASEAIHVESLHKISDPCKC